MRTVAVDINDGENAHAPIENASDGELLEFPPGTFEWPGQLSVARENWGISGHKGDGGETVFIIPDGYGEGTGRHTYVFDTATKDVRNDNCVLENVVFDTAGGARAAPSVRFECSQRGYVGDLEHRCPGPVGNAEQTDGLKAIPAHRDGYVLVRRYVLHNRGRLSDYNGGDSRIGLGCHRGNGELIIEDCRITGCPNNGVYTRMPGTVTVIGGLFGNNNVSQLRFGGNSHSATGATLFLDESAYSSVDDQYIYRDDDSGNYTARLLWNDSRGSGSVGGTVSNCSFLRFNSTTGKGHVEQLDGAAFDVANCQFLLADGNPAVVPNDGPIAVNGCSFLGSGDAVGGNGNAEGINNVTDGVSLSPLSGDSATISITESDLHDALPDHSGFTFSDDGSEDDDSGDDGSDDDGGDEEPTDGPSVEALSDRIDALENRVDSLDIVVA